MNKENMAVLTNVIGAVESGGQIYGKRDYSAYAAPYTNSNVEHTITLGWAQNYGSEAKRLIQMIYDKDTAAFKAIDTDGSIAAMLKKEGFRVMTEEEALLAFGRSANHPDNP